MVKARRACLSEEVMDQPAPRATLDDLYRTKGRAELIGGRIVPFAPLGVWPSAIIGNIMTSLHAYARRLGRGQVFGTKLGYAIAELPSGRESFSPNTSFYDGPLPANRMRFIEGPPTFAVDVRSEDDYGDAANACIATKRRDYFLAGTLAVWDVDVIAETILCYRHKDPLNPVLFARGDTAEAEPAVPGWRMTVDDLFA